LNVMDGVVTFVGGREVVMVCMFKAVVNYFLEMLEC
jgi:hypothetical protein